MQVDFSLLLTLVSNSWDPFRVLLYVYNNNGAIWLFRRLIQWDYEHRVLDRRGALVGCCLTDSLCSPSSYLLSFHTSKKLEVSMKGYPYMFTLKLN